MDNGNSGSPPGMLRQLMSAREIIHECTTAALEGEWPTARFSSLVIRGGSECGDGNSEATSEKQREFSPSERRYCEAVWSEAGLQPIEESRRYQRDHYRTVLLHHPGVEKKFGAQPEFVFKYTMRNCGEKELAGLVARLKNVMGQMAKKGDIQFEDTYGKHVTQFNTSVMVRAPEPAKSIPISLDWLAQMDPKDIDPDTRRVARDMGLLDRRDSHPVPYELQLHAERYRMVLEAGLNMPKNPWGRYPNGVGRLAKLMGISRTTFTASVKKYFEYLVEKQKSQLSGPSAT